MTSKKCWERKLKACRALWCYDSGTRLLTEQKGATGRQKGATASLTLKSPIAPATMFQMDV